MLRRTFLTRMLGLPLGATVLTACAPPPPLAIGIHPWPGYESLYLAETFGWLPATARLHKGHSASDSRAALRDGVIDGAALTLDEVLAARAEGLPLTVILAMNISVGADVVLARPEIAELADLAGKRIAVERSAVGGIVLAKLLEAARLTPTDVAVLDIPHDQQLAAWRAGQVDAVISYAPTDALIEREGARRLFDSRQFPGMIFDVLAMRRDRLHRQTGTLRALVAAHFRGLEHIRTNREDALRRIAAWRGLNVDEAAQGFAGLDLPSVAANRQLLAAAGDLVRAARTLNPIMIDSGLLPGPDSLDQLIDSRYLPE